MVCYPAGHFSFFDFSWHCFAETRFSEEVLLVVTVLETPVVYGILLLICVFIDSHEHCILCLLSLSKTLPCSCHHLSMGVVSSLSQCGDVCMRFQLLATVLQVLSGVDGLPCDGVGEPELAWRSAHVSARRGPLASKPRCRLVERFDPRQSVDPWSSSHL